VKIKIITILTVALIVLSIQSLFLTMDWKRQKKEILELKFLLYTPADAVEKQSLSLLTNLVLEDVKTGSTKQVCGPGNNKNILVYVFSTDCYSCEMVAENVNEVYAQLGSQWSIIGISRDNKEAVAEFAARTHTAYPVYRYRPIPGYDMFGTLPRAVGMDKNGKILFSLTGIPGIPAGLKSKMKGPKP